MSEPVIPVTQETVLAILGQKEVERLMLIARVQQLEARVRELTPPDAQTASPLKVVE